MNIKCVNIYYWRSCCLGSLVRKAITAVGTLVLWCFAFTTSQHEYKAICKEYLHLKMPSSPPRSSKSRSGEFDSVSGSWMGWGRGADAFSYRYQTQIWLQFFDSNFEVRVCSVAPGSSIYSPTASANYGDAFAPFEIAKPGVPAKRLGTTMEVSINLATSYISKLPSFCLCLQGSEF